MKVPLPHPPVLKTFQINSTVPSNYLAESISVPAVELKLTAFTTGRLVAEIMFTFKKTVSVKEIGCRYNVSSVTAMRYLNRCYVNKTRPSHGKAGPFCPHRPTSHRPPKNRICKSCKKTVGWHFCRPAVAMLKGWSCGNVTQKY